MKFLLQLSAASMKVMVLVMTIILFSNNLSATETNSSLKATEHQIVINAFQFEPAVLIVKVGDSISWLNKDLVPHTATASDDSWDTGEILTNQSKSITIVKGTTSSYYCFYHPTMKGKLEIVLIH